MTANDAIVVVLIALAISSGAWSWAQRKATKLSIVTARVTDAAHTIIALTAVFVFPGKWVLWGMAACALVSCYLKLHLLKKPSKERS